MEGENNKPRKTMLHFVRDGVVIPVWGIITINKHFEWNETHRKMSYLIILNQGMEAGTQNCPVGEIKFLYFDEEERDKHYNHIIKTLEDYDVNIINF